MCVRIGHYQLSAKAHTLDSRCPFLYFLAEILTEAVRSHYRCIYRDPLWTHAVRFFLLFFLTGILTEAVRLSL